MPFFSDRASLRPARGFTLIELMLALGIAGIMSSALWGSVYYQNLLFMQRADEDDIHARANAVLGYLGDQLRQAGSGMPFDASTTGLAATGPCTKSPGTVPGALQSTCTGIDASGTSDRLRVVFGVSPTTSTITPSQVGSAAYCNGLPLTVPWFLHYLAPATGSTPYVPVWLDYVLVSGSCVGGTAMAADAVRIIGANPGPATASGCTELSYTNLATNLANLTCTNGYQPNYSMAPLSTTDFYLTPNSNPALPMVLQQDLLYGQNTISQPVAPGISRFQVRYGIDTSTPVDSRLDLCPGCTQDPYVNVFGSQASWCRDPRASDMGGPCNLQDSTGTTLTTAQIYARIIAVYVELDVQRNSVRANAQGNGPAAQITRTYRRLYTLKSRAAQ